MSILRGTYSTRLIIDDEYDEMWGDYEGLQDKHFFYENDSIEHSPGVPSREDRHILVVQGNKIISFNTQTYVEGEDVDENGNKVWKNVDECSENEVVAMDEYRSQTRYIVTEYDMDTLMKKEYIMGGEVQETPIEGLLDTPSYIEEQLDDEVMHKKCSKERVLKILKVNGDLYGALPTHLKKDRDIVLEAARNKGIRYIDVPENLKMDLEIVNTLVEKRPFSTYPKLPEQFLKNKDMLMYALKSINKKRVDDVDNVAKILRSTLVDLNANPDIVEYAMSIDPSAVEFEPFEKRNNKEYMKKMLEKDGRLIRFASDELKKDKELTMLALVNNYDAYDYISEEYKQDKDVVAMSFNIENNVLMDYKGSNSVVVIPEGVRKIGWNSFVMNETIEKVILPNSVEEIEADAFVICKNLKEIVIPKTIKQIAYYAFSECDSLKLEMWAFKKMEESRPGAYFRNEDESELPF